MIKKVLEYLTKLWYAIFRIEDSIYKKEEEIYMGERLTIFDIAHFFSSKKTMSNKKLQKLVYYAYAWYIALNNEDANNIKNRLCDKTKFEAWIHGPVCRELYNNIDTNYGIVDKFKGKINPLIKGDIEDFLDSIYRIFGKYSGDELETMTHKEMPWKNARGILPPTASSNNPILESDMFTYYNSL